MAGMTYAIALFLLAILACLATAGFFLLRKPDASADDAVRRKSMANALGWRVAFSIVLFLSVLAAWQLGYIQPTGLPLAR